MSLSTECKIDAELLNGNTVVIAVTNNSITKYIDLVIQADNRSHEVYTVCGEDLITAVKKCLS